MNRITEHVQEDGNMILYNIRHQIVSLKRIAINIENLVSWAYELELYYDEEGMDKIRYYYERASEEDLLLDEIESDYNENMVELHKHIVELLDNVSNKSIDESYLVTEETSDY